MTDYRAAARKAREQVDLDLGKLRNLGFDDIDVTVVRKRQSLVSGGFAGGFLLGVLTGTLIALIFATRKGQDIRHLLTGAGISLKGNAIDLFRRPSAEGNGSRVRMAGDFGEGPAIEREIGEALGNTDNPAVATTGQPGITSRL